MLLTFTLTSSDALELMTEGSTKPVVTTVAHAGICRVERYESFAPPGSAT
ncbi:hypothetical protein [Bradyrhizobium sp.]